MYSAFSSLIPIFFNRNFTNPAFCSVQIDLCNDCLSVLPFPTFPLIFSPFLLLLCLQCSAKSCRVAFHVTCGLQHSLKMNTILTDEDEVKFKSYCPTHSGMDWHEQSGVIDDKGISGRAKGADGARLSERKLRVQQLEDEFYRFVNIEEVSKHLHVPLENVDFLFQYWKLKRKSNFNQPLITPKREEEESLARREQEVLLRRLRLFTHLRQDLERVCSVRIFHSEATPPSLRDSLEAEGFVVTLETRHRESEARIQ